MPALGHPAATDHVPPLPGTPGPLRVLVYDSLIVAAALEAGCNRILTEDLRHGQRIAALVIEDPFRE